MLYNKIVKKKEKGFLRKELWGDIMFIVGDKVVHPMHGAGVIDSIVREKIGGNYHNYYVFKMPMNGLVL